jgi:hypothetical protein
VNKSATKNAIFDDSLFPITFIKKVASFMNARVITNHDGKPVAVQVSLRQWQRIQKDMEALRQLRTVSADLQESLAEVARHQRGEIEMPTLSNFLASAHG